MSMAAMIYCSEHRNSEGLSYEVLKNHGKVLAEVIPKSNPREQEDRVCWGIGVEKILITEASQMSPVMEMLSMR